MDLPKSDHHVSPSKHANKRLKTSHLPEEKLKKFKYNFIPSLEHAARVNVILLAWNHPNIRNSILNLLNLDNRQIIGISVQWRRIEIEVVEKLKQLPLPKSIIEAVICYAEEVGKSIVGWIIFYENMILRNTGGGSMSRNIHYLDDLVWTTRGTINYIETAQRIMNHDKITDTEKYLIACTFCLEKDIEAIYTKNRTVNKMHETEKCKQPMLWYWNYHTEGRINELYLMETTFTEYFSIYHRVIDLIIYCGFSISGEKDTAIKYFWCKLNNSEKERITKSLLNLCSAECCCFLLSRTSKFLEHKILKKRSHDILEIFIKNVLWVDEIIPIIQYMFQYFEEDCYSEIMKLLLHYLKYYRKRTPEYSFMYYKYAEILKEMWILSPPHYKNDIFERDDDLGAEIIYGLSWEISEKIIRSIFAQITPTQKKDVLESKFGIRKCIYFIKTNQAKSFEEFLSLAFTQQCEVFDFKKNLLEKHNFEIFRRIRKERGWNGCKDFLTWFFKLTQSNENDLWCQLNAIFEEYYDNDVEKMRNKAMLMVYYLSDDNATDADSSSQTEKGSSTLEELVNWYLRPLEIHHVRNPKRNVDLNTLIEFSVRVNNFTLADRILCLFLENDLTAITYKKKFYSFPENQVLIYCFITQDDGFKSLENYLNWCFPGLEIGCFDDYLSSVDMFMVLLEWNKYKLINDYISWLKMSDEEIGNLKFEIMNHVGLCTVAKKYVKDEINEFESTSKLKTLIEWIDPQPVDIHMFLDAYEENCPLNFCQVLHQYSDEKLIASVLG